MENSKQEKSLKNSIERVIITKTNLFEVDYALSKLVEKTKLHIQNDVLDSEKCSSEMKDEPFDLIELLNEQTSDMSHTINNIMNRITYLNNFIG